MGTDINIIIEKKIKNNIIIEKKIKNKWLGIYSSAIDFTTQDDAIKLGNNRFYDFFDKLAGVRQRGEIPQNTPKGLPKDASELAICVCKQENDLRGISNTSYMSAQEFCKLYNQAISELENPREPSTMCEILGIDDYYNNYYNNGEYRVIFYFSS